MNFFFKLHFLKFLYDQTTIDETNSSYLSLDGSTYNEINLSKEWSICIWLWRLMPLSTIFQLYNGRSISCIGGGKLESQRNPYRLTASHRQTWSYNIVSNTLHREFESNPQLIDCTDSCKSNYHTIMTTIVHFKNWKVKDHHIKLIVSQV